MVNFREDLHRFDPLHAEHIAYFQAAKMLPSMRVLLKKGVELFSSFFKFFQVFQVELIKFFQVLSDTSRELENSGSKLD